MKSFFKFCLILFTIFFLSAVLSPVLFDFLPFKFEKIFNRLVMIFSLAAVLLFVRLRREDFRQYGLGWEGRTPAFFLAPFIAGFVTLALIAAAKMGFGYARWSVQDLNFFLWVWAFVKAIFSALLIGLIEEFFFRGFVLLSLSDRFRWGVLISILMTNVFYSSLHFINIEKPLIGPDPTFYDSLRWMAAPFASFAHFDRFWPAAVGLFIFGLILTDLFLRTRSLYPSIGLHAGCVFFIKVDGLFVDFLSNNNTLVYGSAKAYDGMIGWAALLLLWGFLRLAVPSAPKTNP